MEYIIVGAGSSGCTLASRLSEDPATSVLLLEAGPEDKNPLHHVPAGYALLGNRFTWGFRSVPLRSAEDRTIELPQGRVLGGSSTVNAMVVTRGAASDYDRWAAALQCQGWSYREVLPYFRRSETNSTFADEYHGDSGPLGVSHVMPLSVTEAFVRAAQQSGIPFNPDFNGAKLAGTGFYQTSIRDARRSSASAAYLRAATGRQNLTVRTGTTVQKILIENGRAVGVQIQERGRLVELRADKEVLITAGVIGSPKLLMLSGIGPGDELRSLGIPTLLDLPGVGQNLQDHARVDLFYELNGPHSLDRQKTRMRAGMLALEYLLYKRGPCASNLLDGGAFWWTDRSEETPNIQLFFVPHSTGVPYRHGCSVNFYELRPRSRGSVKLRSADPQQHPLIDPNFLADPRDLERTIAGVKVCQSIMSQPALARLIRREFAPGPAIKSDAEYATYARHMVDTGYHMVGTCKMGVDHTAVVTPELRVRGVESLRVCDASIMPEIISGNTNAPTIMIAEKAADLIRGRSIVGERAKPS
jgi:choline dehydrogenase-like flavoprotein